MADDGCGVQICKVKYVNGVKIVGSGSIITGFPWFRNHGENEDWPNALRVVLYLVGLLWLFMGVQIGSDVFMGAIETITSKKTRIFSQKKGRYVTVKVWNDTVANLSLMALGSSAPEILLSVLELVFGDPPLTSGELGPSTIVGSAAFNLFVITAVCVIAIPNGEVRYIKDTNVFAVTASFSIFAYLWLYIVVSLSSPNVVDIWEAFVSLLLFPVLIGLAYAADRGYLCGGTTEEDMHGALTKDDLAEMKMKILKTHGGGEMSDENLLKLMKKEFGINRSRAKYRSNAVRAMMGGKRVMQKARMSVRHSFNSIVPMDGNTSSSVKDDLGGMSGSSLSFSAPNYAVLENVGHVVLSVVRENCLDQTVLVDYKTRDGTAVAGSDYEESSGTLEFLAGEVQKTISIKIIDDATYEEDEEFYVDLINPRCNNKDSLPLLGKCSTAQVAIVDDDEPGTLCFETEEPDVIKVQEGTENVNVSVTVRRKNGSNGAVSCSYETEGGSAMADVDFESLSGTFELGQGETSGILELTILPRGRYDQRSEFRLILSNPTGGAKFDAERDGGPDQNILTVVIESNSESRGRVDRISQLMKIDSDKTKIGFSSYMDQLRSAVMVNGGEDDEAVSPSVFDYVMHCIVVIWKVFFALVPPADFCGGWLCFCISLLGIGYVTACIGDLASMLGCAAGIPDSVTAVTLVALGTSLPDTFASKSAAQQEPHADASIGNVTGSNSVNVFLGLGLPWVIASIYWRSVGRTPEWQDKYRSKPFFAELNHGPGKFVVEGGDDLGFCVVLFSVLATVCILTMLIRRNLFGGELGGPTRPKYFTAVFLVSMWILFIVLYIIQVMVRNPSPCI
eukprot:TRINITY_DN18348_c0_g1_i1.p1 TRINITY_DN18348_c0_g1~~TRINITY_DN18348_c0_g1_i1.p1  ORF type:complete len:848 (+),score=142.79 TRINITY_DN18348_c0_g1_i1:91-2634(+)